MVIKTQSCAFSELRIYPGHGIRYVTRDGRAWTYISKKGRCISLRKTKAQKIRWTVAWRRLNKKIKAGELIRKKKKHVVRIQRAINGLTLEDLQKKRSEKSEVKLAQAQDAIMQIKLRKQKEMEMKRQQRKELPKEKQTKKQEIKAAPIVKKQKTGKGKK